MDDVIVQEVGGSQVDIQSWLSALRVLLHVRGVSVRWIGVVDDNLMKKKTPENCTILIPKGNA